MLTDKDKNELAQAARHLKLAQQALARMTSAAQDSCLKIYSGEHSVNHCVRWGAYAAVELLKTFDTGISTEQLPGATNEEIDSVIMQDLVGDYENPKDIPEWQWVEKQAMFEHAKNGQDGVWEFVLNLSTSYADIPERLREKIMAAKASNASYLIFHQGT